MVWESDTGLSDRDAAADEPASEATAAAVNGAEYFRCGDA